MTSKSNNRKPIRLAIVAIAAFGLLLVGASGASAAFNSDPHVDCYKGTGAVNIFDGQLATPNLYYRMWYASPGGTYKLLTDWRQVRDSSNSALIGIGGGANLTANLGANRSWVIYTQYAKVVGGSWQYVSGWTPISNYQSTIAYAGWQLPSVVYGFYCNT